MIDFILAALPWVALGVAIAIIIAKFAKRPKSSDPDVLKTGTDVVDKTVKQDKDADANAENNYMSYGISLGMCLGVALGCSFMNTYGPNALTYGICFGMLGGMIIGMNIKKK